MPNSTVSRIFKEHKKPIMEVIPIPYNSDNYAYLLSCSKTGHCALVDAGAKDPILNVLREKNINLKKILCTHHHFDHIAAVSDIKAHYPDIEVLGSQNAKGKIPELRHFLKEGDVFSVGETSFEVLESFGHTQSCISFYSKTEKILFSGDCLFLAGCGKLLEGNAEQLYHSLNKIKALPKQTKVYFGHNYNLNNLKFALTVEPNCQPLISRYNQESDKQINPLACCQTTIQEELDTNPFLRLDAKEIELSVTKKTNTSCKNPLDLFTKLRHLKDQF